jgi:hypothetical protein
MWDVYTLDEPAFASSLGAMQPMTEGEILLGDNRWDQGYPWNLYCPADGGCAHTWVGCVATSASQIMRYWEWPPQGKGDHCYFWYGETSTATLCASFEHPYVWADMPLSCGGGCTPTQQQALAQLSYDVGVAYDMQYSCEGSGAYIETDIWTSYFWYHPSTHLEYRSSYTAQEWFDLIVGECEARRPMQFAISPLMHALVCDGWRVFSGNQIHMNYGWGGSTTAWYFIDNIYGSSPADEYMRVGIKPWADSFHVDLSVESANPASGVAISVSPADTNGQSDGFTPFARRYSPGRLVTLQAPSSADGNSFAKWQRDGVDYSTGTTVALNVGKNRTMTAVYLSCAETVGEPWVNPPSPVCVNTLYCVAWDHLPGATSYEIRENGGTWESTGGATSKCYSNSTGGSYSYEVRTVSGCGQGAASLPLTVILESTAPTVPGQPWTDPASPVCVNTEYIVHWDPVPGASGYEIRENGGAWQNTGVATVWYCQKSVAGVYSYEVCALNTCGKSVSSPSVMMTVTTEGASPAAPGQPWVLPPSPMCVGRQYTVRWSPVPGAEYYEIRENGDVWRSCGTATMWGVTKFVAGTWSYEVRALNGCGQSDPGPSATVTMGSCYSLMVYSSDPMEGIPISVTPLDQDAQGNGLTPFARGYYVGTSVTLQAPATFDGAGFLKWLRDGQDYSEEPTITLQIDASHVMTAAFATCNCPQQGDINGDAVIDVFDVIGVIGVAFTGDPDPQDPACPKTRGDVDNNGVTDVFDVIYLIATAFSGGPNPVNPCGP